MVGNKPRISRKSALSTPKPTADEILRVNVTLRGSDIPRWYREWRRRGLVKSCSDAIVQAFARYHEHLLEQDLKAAQLKNLSRASENGSPE